GLAKLFREIELPLVDVLVDMEEAGITVDTRYLATLAVEFTSEVARIEREAYDAVGHDFAINSPKQLQELLFIELKLPRGRRTRRAFVAGHPDRTLLAADYSQIELRVLAHVSADPALVDAFRSGADVHTRTAAAGFGVAESEVTREQRSVAKMLNFGIVYGMSDFGLAWRMGMARDAAAPFI